MNTSTETHTHIRRLYLTVAEQREIHYRAEVIALGKLQVILEFFTDNLDPVARLSRMTRKLYGQLIKARLINECFNVRGEMTASIRGQGTIVIQQNHTRTLKAD